MKTLLPLIIAAGVSLFAESARGSILDMKRLSIDFTKLEDATAKATWSRSDKLAVTDNGLGWEGQSAEVSEGWIQTKPLAVGLSWRPAQSVSARVTIEPVPKPILLNSGQISTPYIGAVYARYSPDARHWSTWQALNPTHPLLPAGETARVFTGTLSIPQREREEYSKFREEYEKLDVPWVDDEEAAVAWMVERDPKFFERRLPFIGYVEFLFEAPFYGGQRITTVNAEVSYGLSGMTMPAKDRNVARDREGAWRFKAK